jgi:hypothetical protein
MSSREEFCPAHRARICFSLSLPASCEKGTPFWRESEPFTD